MAKIVLKNTTKMSLNERFTAYREQTQNAATVFRQKMQAQTQASRENRRLAQQMANRPTVIAALRLKKRSLQQRLGRKSFQGNNTVNIKSRLDLSARPNSNFQGRLGNFNFRANRGRNPQSNRRGRFQRFRSNFVRPGTSPMIKTRLGTQNNFGRFNSQKIRGGYDGRRKFGRGSNRGRGASGFNSGIRRGVGNTRRGGLGNRNRMPVPTKQELDNQLDAYMAETKSPMTFSQGF